MMPRLLRYVLGWLLLIPGFLVFITPVPGGIVMMTAGFLLLYSSSAGFRRGVLNLSSRFPRTKLKLQLYVGFLTVISDRHERPPNPERTDRNGLKSG